MDPGGRSRANQTAFFVVRDLWFEGGNPGRGESSQVMDGTP
jgi:hypothetical protein